MKIEEDWKPRDVLRFLGLLFTILLGFVTIIGSSGGDWDYSPYPLWVETDVVVSDIDLDGRNDVLTLSMLSTSMSDREGHIGIYRQTDQGGFSAPSTYIFGEYPWQLVVSDIDGDMLPDLLVTDVDLDSVQLLLQDPYSNGQFLPPRRIASGITSYEIAVADFNNDAAPDVAISDCQIGSGGVVLLYQDSEDRGVFLPAVDFTVPGSSSCDLAAGDLDGDGLNDLLAWIYFAPSGYTPNGALAIILQQQDGTFGQVTTLAPQTGLNVGHLSIADYNGDGANDLFVFFTPFGADYIAKLTVVLQDPGTGTFASPVDTSLAGIRGIDDAVVADLNGDDLPDFAVVGTIFDSDGWNPKIRSRINVFLQSGGGAFSLAGVWEAPISVTRVASGDIDGDGLNDLIVLTDENRFLVMIQSHSMPGTFNLI